MTMTHRRQSFCTNIGLVKNKTTFALKKLQEFQMASGQRLGICLCVGKGEVRIHDEMEPAEDVIKGRKPKQC